MTTSDEGTPLDAQAGVQALADSADTGGRTPQGFQAGILFYVALAWSLFQLWYASPLSFAFGILNLNFTEARAVHLAFAVTLAFIAFPAMSRSPRHRVPALDWVLAGLAGSSAAYIYVFQSALATRPGAPIVIDVVVGVVGVVMLLEATRRSLGLPLVIVALIFLAHSFAGPWLPGVIAHQGASLNKVMSHQWLTSEGVFGIALGVSASFVFLFVLFGALLDRAGAGAWFIRVSYAALGHLRGGPAKAAVVSSGLTGLISGSSIANVVTTGTFTIPLMKRVGFPAEKAGAVEVASSVNGQIMPPVMGAAAFLMVEYVGIPYLDVIKHAFLPAVISYAALLYIVHLEALKMGLEGLPRHPDSDRRARLLGYGLTASGLLAFAGAVHWGLDAAQAVLGGFAPWVAGGGLMALYVGLLALAAKAPVEEDALDAGRLPPLGATVKSGLYHLIPVVVLIWCLMIERLSPTLSAFWAILTLIFIILTQGPIFALLRRPGGGAHAAAVATGTDGIRAAALGGARALIDGLVAGARNMVGIAIATAAAGIVVGTVTLTGLGLVMTELIELLSGGNLILVLVFTAIISLILGMGLPTTANYIVVATLMAPVVVTLAGENGLIVPLIAVHLFVFYFGLMADVTPPVGLATFAAAAISRADPIRTGVQAFLYSGRTVALPFMFIFNGQLLLIGITDGFHLVLIVLSALLAMLIFAAGTMGWFLDRSRWYETVGLLLVAFTLFRPGFFWDIAFDPYETRPPTEIHAIANSVPKNGFLRLVVGGETLLGDKAERAIALPMGAEGRGDRRLVKAGLRIGTVGSEMRVIAVVFSSSAAKAGVRAGWAVRKVFVPAARPAKEWMFVPALLLLGLIIAVQRRRRRT
jgi:TRAP transporter 4TM/12TM fusion protein